MGASFGDKFSTFVICPTRHLYAARYSVRHVCLQFGTKTSSTNTPALLHARNSGKKGGLVFVMLHFCLNAKEEERRNLSLPFFLLLPLSFPPPPLPLAKRKPERLFKEERRKEREKGGGGGSHCLLASWLMNLSGVCPSSSSSSSPPPSAPPDSTNEIREAFFTAFLCAVT